MKALDSRLQAAADFVTDGGKILDIGTDHGYLPIWLVKNGRSREAIAADVNSKPLESAAENIRAEGLQEKIQTCLTDGMDGIDLGDVSDIVIAGMGGMLIAEILERHLPLAGKNLILQPMTQAPFLRKWLCENGFEIAAETPAEAGGKLYAVLCARYDGQEHPCDLYFSHVGKMTDAMQIPEKSEWARKYLEHLQKKLQVIYFGMSQGGQKTDPVVEDYRELIERLKEVLS
ncbi:MAG: tRNA (adenine(22)-N(1))-methyltransferase [Candidatus Merdivicinus sp.]|jgi:tRNA (adenine22-N1)-methyltransferase